MRFLLVTPHTVPDFSGSGINAFNFARYLVKKGEKVRLLSLNRNLVMKRSETKEGVKIRRLLYLNRIGFLKGFSLLFILPGYFIYAAGSDVVVIYGGRLIAWELLIVFSKMLRKKVIFQSLLNNVDDLGAIISSKPALFRDFYKWIFRKTDVYHALNNYMNKEFLRFVPDESRVLLSPQGVDTGTFSPVSEKEKEDIRDRIGLERDRLVIITIGSLVSRKGYEEMFRIIAGLDFHCQLVVAGEHEFNIGHFLRRENTYARNLIQAAQELSGNKIVFMGGVSNIADYIKASDIALFNSGKEGLPNSVLEVMACGIPPVMREYPGMDGYFFHDRQNALIFQEAAGMVHCVRMLCKDRALREQIGSASRASVEQEASFEIVLKKYREKLHY